MGISKYDRIANGESGNWKANRLGLSETDWAGLSTEEREIHYRRQNVCSHEYVYSGPDPDDTGETALRTAYSFDPYAHTAHLEKCLLPSKCQCQMCSQKIGIARDGRFS